MASHKTEPTLNEVLKALGFKKRKGAFAGRFDIVDSSGTVWAKNQTADSTWKWLRATKRYPLKKAKKSSTKANTPKKKGKRVVYVKKGKGKAKPWTRRTKDGRKYRFRNLVPLTRLTSQHESQMEVQYQRPDGSWRTVKNLNTRSWAKKELLGKSAKKKSTKKKSAKQCAAPGKIGSKERDKLPADAFALPRTRAYPIKRLVNGKLVGSPTHARNAKARAEQQLEKGNLTRSQYNAIVRKADAVLRSCAAASKRKKAAAAKKNGKPMTKERKKQVEAELKAFRNGKK